MSAAIRAKIAAIRVDLAKALDDVALKHGLRAFKDGAGSFTPDGSFTIKCEGIMPGGKSKDEQLYDILRSTSPVFPELGTAAATILYGREPIILIGANSTLSKVLFRKVSNGKVYLAPRNMIEMALKAQQVKP